MVRYPQNNPSQPIKPQGPSVAPKVDNKIKHEEVPMPRTPDTTKDKKEEQVQELQQRLHSLEEKLNSLQHKEEEHAADLEKIKEVEQNDLFENSAQLLRVIGRIWRKSRIVILLVLFLAGLTWGLGFIRGHIYTSTLTLELNPKEFYWYGRTNGTLVGDFSSLETVPQPIDELMALGLTKIKTNEDGKFINVQFFSFTPDHSRRMAEDWNKTFVGRYFDLRRKILNDTLVAIHKEISQTQADLEDTFDQMSSYPSKEQYVLVNAQVKQRLVHLAQENALDLEKDFLSIKDKTSKLNDDRFWGLWSSPDKVLLGGNRLKLTSMELKDLLVQKEQGDIYQEAIRTIKADSARLIKDVALKNNIDDISASLIIENFFLSCRQQAIETVLNKRYVVDINELTAHLARYIHLKEKFEALNFRIRNLELVDSQVQKYIERGLSLEIVVYSPLKVSKY